MSGNGSEGDKAPKRRGRKPRPKAEDGSRDAKRLATAVLEVLAGARTPNDAAVALEVSVPRYYSIEAMAIAGLVSACEPKNLRFSGSSLEQELATLKKEHQKLERECARYQALARVAQRTVALPPPPAPNPKSKRKGHKPRVRALKAIAAIGSHHDEERTQAAGAETRRAPGRLDAGEAPSGDDP